MDNYHQSNKLPELKQKEAVFEFFIICYSDFMLSMNDLKNGIFFIFHDGQPYEILSAHHLKMQQRRPVLQARIKNLLNGKIIEHNFAQSDQFQEADISKKKVKFLYAHRDEYWFNEEKDPSKRFKLSQEILEGSIQFLKSNTLLDALLFNDTVINIELPVKMDFKVVEAPPAIRGNTAQGGVKQVVIETGANINVPLFIKQDDLIRINTQSGEYVERVEKNK